MARTSLLLLALALTLAAAGRERPDTALLHRIFDYAATVDTTRAADTAEYAYTRFRLSVDRKNPTLMLVPTVYAIAHSGQRQYVGETYSRITMPSFGRYESQQLLHVTTVPRRHRTMTTMLRYLTPHVYGETLFENALLSPFHRANRRFYRYRVTFLLNGTARVNFTPRRRNTQLVGGQALVDYYTGRIIRCSLTGEYDMVNFWITLQMGAEGWRTLLPARCDLRTRFRFIRSKVSGRFTAFYGLPRVLTDTIANEDDMELMCRVRPDTLDYDALALYGTMVARRMARDSALARRPPEARRPNLARKILWDIIGDNMLNRVKSNFGINNQGYIRLNPILNPLYMGYDHHRGFTYKFDLRMSYQFGPNSELSTRLKAGYAFRQKQFYFRLPLYYYFDKRRNSYFKLEVGNGNHIRSLSVRRDIERQYPDTAGLGLPDFGLLHEFRQTDTRLMVNINLSDRLGFQLGTLFQRREAVHREAFRRLGRAGVYHSFAPIVELQYRPWGWRGAVFTADYDRGIRGVMGSNTDYERMEFNGEYIHRLNRLQSWQMRVGTGFYTRKDARGYFLDYENFRENNIPGGWNDDWSGEFELLRSDIYNTSAYYVRANATYESPLLLLSWLPWLGHYMEMERVYVSVLDVKSVHPYVELGYGFTTRLFSCGVFVGSGQGSRVFGCKFGFELFRRW